MEYTQRNTDPHPWWIRGHLGALQRWASAPPPHILPGGGVNEGAGYWERLCLLLIKQKDFEAFKFRALLQFWHIPSHWWKRPTKYVSMYLSFSYRLKFSPGEEDLETNQRLWCGHCWCSVVFHKVKKCSHFPGLELIVPEHQQLSQANAA